MTAHDGKQESPPAKAQGQALGGLGDGRADVQAGKNTPPTLAGDGMQQ